MMNIKSENSFLIYFSALVAGCLLFLNCGVKKNPIPPNARSPEPIMDLSHRIDNGVVVLSWAIPTAKKEGPVSIQGFLVYRGKKAIKGSICPKCPSSFKRLTDISIGDLSVEERARNSVSFADALEKNHKYTYKVIVYFKNGRKSDDSNFVEFSY